VVRSRKDYFQTQASKFGRLIIEEEGGDYQRKKDRKIGKAVCSHTIKEEMSKWNSHLKKRNEWIDLGGRF